MYKQKITFPAVPQLAGVHPAVTVTLPTAILFKSKPLVATEAAESGIPLLPRALSAMGIVIARLPPMGTAPTVVNVTFMVPDWEATAYPDVSRLLARGAVRLK